jgi:CHAD domain-containing protein
VDKPAQNRESHLPFRLRRDEKSVPDGLRRLATKQLRQALVELDKPRRPEDEALHKARTRVKKVRALLHLVEADRGRHLSDSKKRLRAVNGHLSKLRDADATLEVFDKIKDANRHLMSEHAFARVRGMLSRHKQEAVRKAQRDRSRENAAITIRTLQKSVKHWRQSHDGFGGLAAGLRTTHRRGRKAMERALKSEQAGDFHEWRKQIKTLWYELRLLEACGTGIQKDIQALDRAEGMLGDDHNTVVMGERLFDDTMSRPDADLEKLRCAVEKFQRRLRRQAVGTIRRIYGVPSRAYVQRIKNAWKRWHRASTSRARRNPRIAAA